MGGLMTRPPVRRIVTGHDDQGRAIILSDGAAPNHWSSEVIPGFGATVPWLTAAGRIDHVTDADPAAADAEIPSFPAAGETILRIADFPPDAVYPVDEGEATMRAGDVAVQRATSHAWSNRTDRTARVLFVLIGTEPLTASQIAERRREASRPLESA